MRRPSAKVHSRNVDSSASLNFMQHRNILGVLIMFLCFPVKESLVKLNEDNEKTSNFL